MAAIASCPKCKTERDPASTAACRKCGLAAARMPDYARDAEQRDANIPEVLASQWARVDASWDDQRQHDELLRLVSQHDAYAWAVAHYREEQASGGERDYRDGRTDRSKIATEQIERLRKAAEVTLLASASRKPDAEVPSYKATRAVLLVLIVSAVALFLYSWLARQKPPPPDSNVVPPAPAAEEETR